MISFFFCGRFEYFSLVQRKKPPRKEEEEEARLALPRGIKYNEAIRLFSCKWETAREREREANRTESFACTDDQFRLGREGR